MYFLTVLAQTQSESARFQPFYCFNYYFYFCYNSHLLSKYMKRCSLKLILWQVELVDQEYIEEKIYITCHGKNSLLFVTPAKESTLVATHHANEIWQV